MLLACTFRWNHIATIGRKKSPGITLIPQKLALCFKDPGGGGTDHRCVLNRKRLLKEGSLKQIDP